MHIISIHINSCIIFRCLHILHMFLYISPKSQVTPQVSHPKTSQRRHAGPIPSWCGDRSLGTLDGAEEGTPQGEWVIKSWRKPWGKRGKRGFQRLDSGGLLKLSFGSTQMLGKWVFLFVADPKLSVVIPNSPFSVGKPKGLGVLQDYSLKRHIMVLVTGGISNMDQHGCRYYSLEIIVIWLEFLKG